MESSNEPKAIKASQHKRKIGMRRKKRFGRGDSLFGRMGSARLQYSAERGGSDIILYRSLAVEDLDYALVGVVRLVEEALRTVTYRQLI